MKLTTLALLLLPTSILALNGEGSSPHRLDRSSISRTQQKKDILLEGRQPCHGGAKKAPIMDADLIYILPIGDLDSLVSDEVARIPVTPTELRPGHAHAHGNHHLHHHGKGAWRHSFAGRLDRAIDQLEPSEAAFLSFVFGFGLMSLFGVLFTITRRLVVRKRACKARRAAQAAAVLASPPAYPAAAASLDEKVTAPAAEEETFVLLEHQ